MSQVLRLDNADAEDESQVQVRLIDKSVIKILSLQVKTILADSEDGKMTLDKFMLKFKESHPDQVITDAQLRTDLAHLVIIEEKEDEETTIFLRPLKLCAVRIYQLLKDHHEKIPMADFEAAFSEKYNVALCPGQYGFPGLTNMITALCDDFVIRGRGAKKMICIAQPGKSLSPPSQIQRLVHFLLRLCNFLVIAVMFEHISHRFDYFRKIIRSNTTINGVLVLLPGLRVKENL